MVGSRSTNKWLTDEVVVTCWLVNDGGLESQGDPIVVSHGSVVVDRAVLLLDINGFVVDVVVADGLVASVLLTHGT